VLGFVYSEEKIMKAQTQAALVAADFLSNQTHSAIKETPND
jgi:hypothetical protein